MQTLPLLLAGLAALPAGTVGQSGGEPVSCTSDINLDLRITVDDLLGLLAQYGSVCADTVQVRRPSYRVWQISTPTQQAPRAAPLACAVAPAQKPRCCPDN